MHVCCPAQSRMMVTAKSLSASGLFGRYSAAVPGMSGLLKAATPANRTECATTTLLYVARPVAAWLTPIATKRSPGVSPRNAGSPTTSSPRRIGPAAYTVSLTSPRQLLRFCTQSSGLRTPTIVDAFTTVTSVIVASPYVSRTACSNASSEVCRESSFWPAARGVLVAAANVGGLCGVLGVTRITSTGMSSR